MEGVFPRLEGKSSPRLIDDQYAKKQNPLHLSKLFF
jgi:hypothetical protein